jgi:arylformamidase
VAAWIEVSLPLSEETPVWPGDVPFARRWTARRASGETVNTSAWTLSAHTGTHLDAPRHLADDGPGLEALAPDVALGPCRVVSTAEPGRVDAEDVRRAVPARGERILWRTGPRDGREAFQGITPEAARLLAAAGIRLVGVDLPSVDPPRSAGLPAHTILLGAGIPIIENLRLHGIRPGRYEMAALPLAVPGGDASPLRVLLRPAGD